MFNFLDLVFGGERKIPQIVKTKTMCSYCDGKGQYFLYVGNCPVYMKCGYCKGIGYIGPEFNAQYDNFFEKYSNRYPENGPSRF